MVICVWAVDPGAHVGAGVERFGSEPEAKLRSDA